MKKAPLLPILAFCALFFTACKNDSYPKVNNPNYQTDAANPEYMHRSLQTLTYTVKHDIFPPMIAARIYAYSHIAAYEAMIAANPKGKNTSLAGQLNGLAELPKAPAGATICTPVAALKAYMKVGKMLTFTPDSIDAFEAKVMSEFKQMGVPREVFEASVALGDTIGGAVLAWAKKDNYAQTRSMPKYTVKTKNPATWKPTMPDYADAIEPNWNKIRPMFMDSAAQFKPIPPTKYDSIKGSKFYQEAYEVYKSVQDSTPERIATGWYWDDSPMAVSNSGHVNFVRKKITPGGHWLHITMYLVRAEKFDFATTTEAYLRVALGLFDGFISCWDEKYRSEVVRPETYIGQFISPHWTPIIVTPAFPEYTSGHSVISGASAAILTDIFGDKKAFTDSTEVQFGMPPRSFNSFNEAAEQAAISRFYAGIHYMPAIKIGLDQGRNVAHHLIKKVKTRQ